jgi:thiol-disulfide isomerase/thioredoxin
MVSLQVAIAAFALSGVGQTVLLDFYSDNCGPCRAMDPTVQALISAGYPVQRINVDRNRELAVKFGVDRWPCFIMVVNGQAVDRQVGMTSRERLEQMCRSGAASASPAAASAEPRRHRLFGRNNAAGPPQPNPPLVSLPPAASSQPPADLRGSQPPTASAQPPADANNGLAWQEPRNQSIPVPPTPMPLKQATVSDAALLAASVRLRIEDPDGRSCGSGTIIDSRQGKALILTCGHIFRDSQGKGRISVELFGAGSSEPQPVEGRLVSYNLDHDIGLVAIDAPGPVAAARLAPPDYRITAGMPVASVGCDHGDPPTIRHTQITDLNKFQGPPNVEVAGQPEQGRSGGGLFSSEGHVIGVCNCADPSMKEGLFAALASVYAELDRNDMAFIYKSPSGSLDAAPAAAAPIPSTMPAPLSGSNDLMAMNSAAGGPGPSGVMPASAVEPLGALPAHERAFLEEIRRNEKEGADIICIIRPRGKADAKNQVIMLDEASSGCVRQLTADGQRQDRPHETSLELPKPRKVILEWTKPAGAP